MLCYLIYVLPWIMICTDRNEIKFNVKTQTTYKLWARLSKLATSKVS